MDFDLDIDVIRFVVFCLLLFLFFLRVFLFNMILEERFGMMMGPYSACTDKGPIGQKVILVSTRDIEITTMKI